MKAFKSPEAAEKWLASNGWDGTSPVAFYWRKSRYLWAGYAPLGGAK